MPLQNRLAILALVAGMSLSTGAPRAQVPTGDASSQLLDEGRQALAAGRFEIAERDYEKVRDLEPRLAEPHVSLGLVYFEERRYQQAVTELRAALKLQPNHNKVDALLAMSLAELGEYEEAAPGLEKGFRTLTDPPVKRMCGLELERTYTALHRDRDAVQVALELNRLYPDDPEILYNTAKVYGSQAYLSMQTLAQVAPDSVWRHQANAEALESQGSYEAAIQEYRKVLELDPHRPNIHYRIGRTLLARSSSSNAAADTASAAQEFEQELQLDPANGNAAYELAEIHRKASEYEKAQQLFELALKYHPDFEEAHVGLADVLLKEGKAEPAAEHLRKALALNSGDEVAWYRLALVERKLGNAAEEQKALVAFKRLHTKTLEERGVARTTPATSEVTKQELDAKAVQ